MTEIAGYMHDAIADVERRITNFLGLELRNILDVSAEKQNWIRRPFPLSERELRIIRYCLNGMMKNGVNYGNRNQNRVV